SRAAEPEQHGGVCRLSGGRHAGPSARRWRAPGSPEGARRPRGRPHRADRIDVGARRRGRDHAVALGIFARAVDDVPRPRRIERVDDAAVVQVYADGFRDLPVKEKKLVWHLYQAAIAGRDIFYDQRYAHNLEMRDVLEAIVAHPGATDPDTLSEIRRYTKLFW